MSNFGFQKEPGRYEDIDEDELLATLTCEEIQELQQVLADIEPDEMPAGLRQEDQTSKRPTGTFCREALLKFWESENNRSLEDSVDESQKDKKEKCATEEHVDNEDMGDCHNRDHKQKNDGKNQAGPNNHFMDSLLSQSNLNSDVNSRWKPKGIGEGLLHHADSNLKLTPERPSGNPTDIDKTLEKILRNDVSVSSVNLNNIENIPQGVLVSFADALISNTQVEIFSLANTHADDQVALALANMLKKNDTITKLNVESNYISGKGLLALVRSLQCNTTLVELRFHNQRHICGGKVEMEMVNLLRENTTLLKLGYQFDLPGPRMSATNILTRNQDRQRQRRLQQKKKQDNLQSIKEHIKTMENVDNMLTSRSNHNSVSSHVPNHPESQPNSAKNVPARKIAEMVKKPALDNSVEENTANANNGYKLTGDKQAENIKPASLRRRDGSNGLAGSQGSMRDDLLVSIRGRSFTSKGNS